jgi:glutathione S-transferase
MSLTLYYHPLASFCHKVLIALDEIGVESERRVIHLLDKAYKVQPLAIRPIGKFPVIRDHGRQRDLAESTIVIAYVDCLYGGAHPLIPRDWEGALEARLWDRFFDNYLQGPVQQTVADHMRGAKFNMGEERATLETAYRMVDRQIRSRTGSPEQSSAWRIARPRRRSFMPTPSSHFRTR